MGVHTARTMSRAQELRQFLCDKDTDRFAFGALRMRGGRAGTGAVAVCGAVAVAQQQAIAFLQLILDHYEALRLCVRPNRASECACPCASSCARNRVHIFMYICMRIHTDADTLTYVCRYVDIYMQIR